MTSYIEITDVEINLADTTGTVINLAVTASEVNLAGTTAIEITDTAATEINLAYTTVISVSNKPVSANTTIVASSDTSDITAKPVETESYTTGIVMSAKTEAILSVASGMTLLGGSVPSEPASTTTRVTSGIAVTNQQTTFTEVTSPTTKLVADTTAIEITHTATVTTQRSTTQTSMTTVRTEPGDSVLPPKPGKSPQS